jgi:hypothetical protein
MESSVGVRSAVSQRADSASLENLAVKMPGAFTVAQWKDTALSGFISVSRQISSMAEQKECYM